MAFYMDISGSGSVINIQPQGIIDLDGARALIEAVKALTRRAQMSLVEIDLAGVRGLTKAAWRLLAASDIPVEMVALAGYLGGASKAA